MRSKLSGLLGSPLPKEYRPGFEHYYMRANYWPYIAVGGLVMLFEAGMLVATLLRPGAFGTGNGRAVYFALYLLLFFLTLAFVSAALLFRRWLQGRPRVFNIVCAVYGLLICLWASYMVGYGHRRVADITVFLYVSLAVALLIPLRLWHALLLYGVNLAFFHTVMTYYRGPEIDLFGSIMNSVIVTLLSVAISAILYRSRAIDYWNRRTIEQQNQRIRTINGQLQTLALTDDLTQAYNRRFFEEVLPDKLNTALAEGQTVSVMMLDIDHFKLYNDVYGHQAGDICLQAIARQVRSVVQREKAYFVRYGGEEFVLFVAGSGTAAALVLAEAIRGGVEALNIENAGAATGRVTVSVGVYVCPPARAATLQRLVHNADAALYAAKNAGRNRVQMYGEGPAFTPQESRRGATT